ncbi:MAG: endolytic transglycosylase MltG [Myxococcota bacterium]
MRRIIKVGFSFIFALSLVAFGIYSYLIHWAYTPGPNLTEVEVIIERGASAHQIGRDLQKARVISNPFLFYTYVRLLTRTSRKLMSGDYLIPPGTTPERIVYMLERGLQREFRFTIPEGASLKDIVDIISKSGVASKENLALALANPLLLEELKIPHDLRGGIEGYLFPETYIFQAGTLPMDIFRHMHDELMAQFTPEMKARINELGFTLNEVLTFASLIEKETGAASERPLIASVFYNRLKKGMKLQTDPTVVYGVDRPKGKIKRIDLKHRHEYNTYLHAGLPPGPIAAPGLAAIKAVLWPAKSNYLYFVSRGNGTHEFCPTYACHVAGIKKYLKRSPAPELTTPDVL